MRSRSLRGRALDIAGILVLVAIVFVGARHTLAHPRWNWDVVGYVACAREFTTRDIDTLQRWTYSDIDRGIPQESRRLRNENTYCATVSRDPESFAQQLPFYRIRLIYDALILCLIVIGISGAWATIALALVAAAAIPAIVFAFARRRGQSPFSASLLASAVMLSVPIMDTARSSSPDTLVAAFVLTGIALATTGRRYRWGLALLIASIAVRTDIVALVVPLCVALAATETDRRRRIEFIATGVIAVAAVIGVQWACGWYGWATVFHHTFIGPLPYPATTPVQVTASQYVDQLIAGLSGRGRDRALAYLVVAIGITFWARRRAPRLAAITLAIAMSLVLHYSLFPVWWKRFFVAQYAIILVTGAWVLSEASRHLVRRRCRVGQARATD